MKAAETLQQRSPPPRMTWRTVLAAWCGITRVEVIAAFLFGSAYVLYGVIVHFRLALLYLPMHFVVGQICAFTLMLCIVVADYVTGRDTRRRAAYALAVVASAAVVAPVESFVLLAIWPEIAEMRILSVGFFGLNLEKFAEWLILGGAATFVYTDRRRALAARAQMHAAELERTHTAKRTIESRLQAMQARVEPQFLFNTLAQVKRLYAHDPGRGERMLDELITYLRAAMPKMRDTSSTVSQELELVRAYLAIVKVPLGDRLTYEIESPPALADVRMPPMLLLPLVGHAIMHGLAAPRSTGSIRIRTAIADEKVRLEIADSGDGFLPESEGDDIAGIRERLAALHGSDASLVLQNRKGGATEAVLELPLERAAQSTDPTGVVDSPHFLSIHAQQGAGK